MRYRIELSNDQRDFIAGKKNGKIIRIMNAASVFIKLLPFNEYNFYIDLYSEYPPEATNGLKLLEEELSSELAFYIPETYHKKVIGAGGSTIQGIMRKYNVFIKFSSGFDCNPNGFTHNRSKNVLIRCPSKNAKEILPAKQELLDTVFDRSQEHGNTFVRLSRSHMRILLTQQNDFVIDIENKTNTIIIFPGEESLESPENLVEIKGVLGTSDAAARLIKAMLPEDYEFKVAFSPRFESFVSETNPDFFEKVIVPFRVALKIEVQVYPKLEHSAEEAPYHQIVLSFSQEHSVGLEDAIQILTAYLRDKDLDIIDRGEFHIDPIVQGTAAALTHSSTKRRTKGDRGDFKSRDFDAGFNPPTRPRNLDVSRPSRMQENRPPSQPARMNGANGYDRNGPQTPSRSYRDPDLRQASHPYHKQLQGQPQRTFRRSPQSNRLKYQGESSDFDYRQPPPQQQYYAREPPSSYPPQSQYSSHHQVPPQQSSSQPPSSYDSRLRPPQASPSRHSYSGYPPQGYSQHGPPHERHGYHRSSTSESYRQQEPPAYYGSRYQEGPPPAPTEPPRNNSRYRDEWGREYRQPPPSGFAPSGPVGPPGPPSGPYSEGYERSHPGRSYY